MNLIRLRSLCCVAATSCLLSVCSTVFGQLPPVSSVYLHYSADNPANIISPALSQTFTSSQIDIANQTLTLSNLGFGDITYPLAKGRGTPVYFSTTGTLPAPLAVDTPYYLIPVTGGYKVYPLAVDADAPSLPGGVLGEKIMPAQNAAQAVNNIVFTSGGSGTHTLYSQSLVSTLMDMSGNGYNSVAPSTTEKHSFLELVTDENSKQFVRNVITMREPFVGSYNAYGKILFQTPSTKRIESRQRVAEKRVVYQIFVGRVRSFHERQVVKFMPSPADMPGNNQIPYAIDPYTHATESRMSNKIVTGDLINCKAYPGSTLPAPLAANQDYYARKVDAKFLTLHPTAADATNNTNVIALTTQGTGTFMFWAPKRVGDARRWSFFAEVLAPNSGGNTLSARLQEPVPSTASIVKIATAFVVSGSNNGNIAGFANIPELSPVILWTPPRSVLPAPLQAGVKYWVTKTPGSSSNGRLHTTLASAQASVGVATSACSCIKYTAAGDGEMLTSYDDGASGIAYGTLTSAPQEFTTRMPLGPLAVYVFKIDFNDPSQSAPLGTLGINQAVTESKLLGFAKGLTPAFVDDNQKSWTMFNSAQGHVPIDMDFYECVFGSSTDAVPDSDIQALVDYFKNKYEIGQTP